MNRESAEEKLLRLIKGASVKLDKQSRQQKGAQKTEEGSKGKTLIGSKDLRIPELVRKGIKIRTFSLELINRILRIAAVLILIFFIFDIIYSSRKIVRAYKEEASDAEKIDFASFPRTLEGEFSDYSASLHDIFTASKGPGLSGGGVVSVFDPAQYIGNLRLLGIISGVKPQAIIEDLNEKKNYTVSVGDYFKDFLSEEVGGGKVRLDYQGEKFDLFL